MARWGREVAPEALGLLADYPWPGNVRQLRNTLESVLVFAPGPVIGPDDLPAEIRRTSENREVIRSAVERGLTLAEPERDYVFEVLCRAGGNKTRAAEMLGIPRRTLYRRLDDTPRTRRPRSRPERRPARRPRLAPAATERHNP